MEKFKELTKKEMEVITGGGKKSNDEDTGIEDIVGDRVPYSR